MKETTIKVSVETRERLREMGGATYEDTVVEAHDALEADRFWAEAEAAALWRQNLPSAECQLREEAEAVVDRSFRPIR